MHATPALPRQAYAPPTVVHIRQIRQYCNCVQQARAALDEPTFRLASCAIGNSLCFYAGMARHYCPNDWSREEFAQRLQDLLELAPTLLPGNSSAHRGADQVGSDPYALQADA